jgi:hypothetical protein
MTSFLARGTGQSSDDEASNEGFGSYLKSVALDPNFPQTRKYLGPADPDEVGPRSRRSV